MRDVNYNQGAYHNWKEYALQFGIDGISNKSSEWIMKYLFDLEEGKNLNRGSRKGARSFNRLNAYRHTLTRWAKLLEGKGKASIVDADLNTIHSLMASFSGDYSPATISSFGRELKAFWNWHMRTQRLEGHEVKDICADLQTAPPKTRFVYITKEQLDEMLPYFDGEEQLLTLFLFDTLVRPPKEVLNLKVKDVYQKDGEVWINIPDEIAKNGMGRTFNLLFTGDAISKHIEGKNQDDYLFLSQRKYKFSYLPKLKQVAKQLFGDKISHPKAQKRYTELSPYDLRHCGAIHLRILANKNNNIPLDAIRQRGGWRDFDMLNYYTQFLGLTGEIRKEALLVEEDKSKIEKRLLEQEETTRTFVEWTQTANSWLRILAQQQLQNKDIPEQAKEILRGVIKDAEEVDHIIK